MVTKFSQIFSLDLIPSTRTFSDDETSFRNSLLMHGIYQFPNLEQNKK